MTTTRKLTEARSLNGTAYKMDRETAQVFDGAVQRVHLATPETLSTMIALVESIITLGVHGGRVALSNVQPSASRSIADGERVRAEDFEPRPGRGACYVEGTVRAVVDDVVFIEVAVDMFGGERQPAGAPGSRVGQTITTPMPGRMLLDWRGRLTALRMDAGTGAAWEEPIR